MQKLEKKADKIISLLDHMDQALMKTPGSLNREVRAVGNEMLREIHDVTPESIPGEFADIFTKMREDLEQMTTATAPSRFDMLWGSVRSKLLVLFSDVAYHAAIKEADEEEVKREALHAGRDRRKVFIVHGRNMKARDAMFAFLRSIDLKPMEWSEAVALTAETNPFIGDILDAAFKAAQAFVVLLTPDETVTLDPLLANERDTVQDKGPIGQARPNVIFEAGMAMALYRNRTVIVELGEVRSFSDIAGRHVLYLSNKSECRQDLADRLKAAGCPVNITARDWHKAGDFSLSEMLKPNAEVSQNKKSLKQPGLATADDGFALICVGPKEATLSMSEFQKARDLLLVAAFSDSGKIETIDDACRFIVSVENRVLNENTDNRRESLKWRDSVQQLYSMGLIEPLSPGKYLVTHKGYDIGDRLDVTNLQNSLVGKM